MRWRELQLMVVVAIAIGGVTASLAVRHQTQTRLREKEAQSRRHNDELVTLAAEQQHFSNLLAQATSPSLHPNSSREESSTELLKLRSQADLLRNQANQLAKQLADNGRSWASQTISKFDSITRTSGGCLVVSDANSDDYASQLSNLASVEGSTKLSDARNLVSALRKYAKEHQAEIPSTFDPAAPYLNKDDNHPPPQTSDFEIVYQGSLDELTNIPKQGVALLREQQPWQTPNGKWARIYALADGQLCIVESDDNFRAWDAEHIIRHIIPPALAWDSEHITPPPTPAQQ